MDRLWLRCGCLPPRRTAAMGTAAHTPGKGACALLPRELHVNAVQALLVRLDLEAPHDELVILRRWDAHHALRHLQRGGRPCNRHECLGQVLPLTRVLTEPRLRQGRHLCQEPGQRLARHSLVAHHERAAITVLLDVERDRHLSLLARTVRHGRRGSRPELDAVIAVKESCRAGPHQTVHGLEETLASGHLGEVGRHAELHVGQILASAVDDRVQRVPGGQK